MYRFAHPVTYGDYPKTMRALVGNRLPKFTEEESKMLKGSLDFLAVNYYTTQYAESAGLSNSVNLSYSSDWRIKLSSMISFSIYLFIYFTCMYTFCANAIMLFIETAEKNGVPIGTPVLPFFHYIWRNIYIYLHLCTRLHHKCSYQEKVTLQNIFRRIWSGFSCIQRVWKSFCYT